MDKELKERPIINSEDSDEKAFEVIEAAEKKIFDISSKKSLHKGDNIGVNTASGEH